MKYMQPLLDRVQKREIDASFVISHRLSLEEAQPAYETFRVMLDPWEAKAA
jgi:threonine dehydrogenase-like Zn-dependent dehydrogenase